MLRQIFRIMGRHHMKLSFASFYILLFFFFFFFHIFILQGAEDPCGKVDCGQGQCVASSASLLGFDCLCKPGWTKMQLGPIVFPACSVPNCSISSQCGNEAPPPGPPANPPHFDIFNPCSVVWCGEGTCVPNGLGYHCKCNDGSANLFNLTGVACFKECSLGADCKGVELTSPPLSPPPTPGNAFGSPHSSSSELSTRAASTNVPNCSANRGHLFAALLFSTLLSSI